MIFRINSAFNKKNKQRLETDNNRALKKNKYGTSRHSSTIRKSKDIDDGANTLLENRTVSVFEDKNKITTDTTTTNNNNEYNNLENYAEIDQDDDANEGLEFIKYLAQDENQDSLAVDENHLNKDYIPFVNISEDINEATDAKLTPIVMDAGSKKISLYKTINDEIIRYNNPDPPEDLVLSGGGAKGAGYIGAISATEELGMLDNIKNSFGASVGAFTAYLVALGATAQQIKQVTDKIKGSRIISFTKEKIPSQGKPKSLIDKMKAMVVYVHHHIVSMLRLGDNLEAIINESSAKILLARIEEHGFLDNNDLQEIITKLKKQQEDPQNLENTISFNDLSFLSNFLPNIKKLYMPVTVKIAKDYELAVFSTDNFADTPIATAVRMSASIPRVFPSYKKKDLVGLQGIEIIDGGCMLNTPHRDALFDNFGSKKDKSLVFIFDKMTDIYEKKGFFASIIEYILKVPLTKLKYEGKQKQSQYSTNYYTIPTKIFVNGKKVSNHTLNFFIKERNRDALQIAAKSTTAENLIKRQSTKDQFIFSDLEHALHASSDQDLLDIDQASPDLCKEITAMRKLGYKAIDKIKNCIKEYDNDTRTKAEKNAEMISQLDEIEINLKENSVFINWFATFINDAATEDFELSRFLDITREIQLKTQNCIFFNEIHHQRAKREHVKKISYMIKTHIYPVLHKYTISNHNRKLLITSIEKLQNTESAKETIDILKILRLNYKQKKPRDVFFIDEMAKYIKVHLE